MNLFKKTKKNPGKLKNFSKKISKKTQDSIDTKIKRKEKLYEVSKQRYQNAFSEKTKKTEPQFNEKVINQIFIYVIFLLVFMFIIYMFLKFQ